MPAGLLAAVAAATIVLTSDVTAMSVALPTIETDLETDLTSAQWVMNAYLIAFGLSIVTGGWLADRLGARRTLIAGLAGFGLFALLGGLAPSVWTLVPARALQGLAAGLIWPSVLALAFRGAPADRRVLAVGVALGAAGVGEAVGPLVGGLVTDGLSWRWILLVKPVAAAIAIAICVAQLEPEARRGRVEVDRTGIALLSVSLFALLYALDEAVTLGWGSPRIVGALALSALAGAAFASHERRARSPLLPPEVLRAPRVREGALLMAATAPFFFVALLYVPQLLSGYLGYTPLKTGLAMLPMQVTFAIAAPLCGLAAARFGLKGPHVCGLLVMATSALLFSRFGAGDGYGTLLPAMLLYGVGVGLAYPAVTALVMEALGAPRAGLGAGSVFMVELVAGGLAVAVATTAVASADDFLGALQLVMLAVAVVALAGAALALRVSPGARSENLEPARG